MKRAPRPKPEEPLTGKKYWRSLEEELDSPEFQEWVEREFPEGTVEMSDPISRRKFLTIMGASFLLAGLASCRRPVEKIVPYVKAPEDITPGIAQYYATTCRLAYRPAVSWFVAMKADLIKSKAMRSILRAWAQPMPLPKLKS
jgi:MoCo/4Fe-4S cofactor protein with predicted Tat translocation signal